MRCDATPAVGTVPPFGHRRQLPVLVDAAITAYATCYAGGGSENAEIFLSVPELLRASAATVADVSKPGAAAPAGEEAAAQRQRAAAAAAALPMPWQPGQEEVELLGVVAHRRKIAKLLLFANLVPLDTGGMGDGADGNAGAAEAPPPAAHGTAAFLRRLWRHPGTGAPCEVQLIMGKTLERRLGRCATRGLSVSSTARMFRATDTGLCSGCQGLQRLAVTGVVAVASRRLSPIGGHVRSPGVHISP